MSNDQSRKPGRAMPSRRAMAAVGAGTVALSAAIAFPALALSRTANDLTPVPASVSVSSPTALPPLTPEQQLAATFAGLTPEQQWAFNRFFWTPEQELAFAFYVATPEERAAFVTFTTPPPPPKPKPRSGAPVLRVSGGGGGFLGCVRNRESRGNYGAVNGSSGAGGAYQFMPQTWNNTARHAGRSDLVGQNPSQVSGADQDAMAQHLLSWQGAAPWGGGC